MAQVHNSAKRTSGEPAACLASEVCANLESSLPSREEIYRYLGYAKDAFPAPHLASRIEEIIEEVRLCLQPRGAFALYAVTERTRNSLAFGGTAIVGQVSEFMATADRIAVFVATIGDEISKRGVQSREHGDSFAQWVVDAFGSWAAEAAAESLMSRIRCHARRDEALTLRYSPGYCGMAMDQQQTIFQLVSAEAIGVSLLPSMLMYPLKSVSGLVGIGPKEKVSTYRAPCDNCDRVGCHMRR